MRRLLAGIFCLPLLLAACGSDDEKASSSSSSSVKITAGEPGDEQFSFDPKEATAKAGKVTLTLDLPGDLKAPHGIAIEGGKTGAVVKAGSASTVTETLKAGTYTFYCPVGDHREEGMEGTLTVS